MRKIKSNKTRPQAKKSKVSKRKPAKRMASGDIIKLILADHTPLKRLIKVLKSEDKALGERQRAFQEFSKLLICHAQPEEQSLYVAMKDIEKLRAEGYEGDVEHGLADQMVEEAKREQDTDRWSAKVKVLAELVEHHIKEEEQDMLPDYKRLSQSDERVALGEKYRRLRERLLAQGGQDTIPEAKLRGVIPPEIQVHH